MFPSLLALCVSLQMVLDHALKTALTRTLLTTVSTAGEQRAALNQFDGYDAHLFTRPYNAVI